jgi:hypothetical protein
MQAHAAREMPILLSYGTWSDWLDEYQQSFDRILVDSGAFSVLNSGAEIDVLEYRDWSERWRGRADAIAGLDDIGGDWRASVDNYDEIPWGFPTFHDTDPPDFLPELVAMARERGGWLGLGLLPPRRGKERWIRETLERIPDELHVHVWAGRQFLGIPGFRSTDSTNWFRDAMSLRKRSSLEFLTIAECLDLVVLRYRRETRRMDDDDGQARLF